MNDNENDGEVIRLECAVAKVQTLADGSLRITLDAPESAVLEAAKLMACQAQGVYLKAEFRPESGRSR